MWHSSHKTVLMKQPPNSLSTNVCFTSCPYSETVDNNQNLAGSRLAQFLELFLFNNSFTNVLTFYRIHLILCLVKEFLPRQKVFGFCLFWPSNHVFYQYKLNSTHILITQTETNGQFYLSLISGCITKAADHPTKQLWLVTSHNNTICLYSARINSIALRRFT